MTGFIEPQNGGQLRTYHVLQNLANRFDVTLFCPYLPSLVILKNSAPIKNSANRLHRFIYRTCQLRIIGRLVKSIYLLLTKPEIPKNSLLAERIILQNYIDTIPNPPDIIIYDTLRLAPTAPKTNPITKSILLAHNVDSILPGSGNYEVKMESNLSKYFHGIIACTKEDALRFQSMNPGIHTEVWANGSTLPKISKPAPKKGIDFLFVGSLDYLPNIEAVEHLALNITPHLKNYKISVAGRNPDARLSKLIQEAGIQLIANPDNISEIYSQSKVCIVPLLSGSGSRLKIAEALLHGVPVVSTAIGAEGYPAVTGLHVLEDNAIEEFATTAKHLHKSHDDKNKSLILSEAKQFLWENTIKPSDLFHFANAQQQPHQPLNRT